MKSSIMKSSIMKFVFLFVAMSVITSCDNKIDRENINTGMPFEDYFGMELPPIPDNIIELLAESPCWEIEKIEYADVIDGKYYFPSALPNLYLGVGFGGEGYLNSIFTFNKDGYANMYYYAVVGKPSDNNAKPVCNLTKEKISKILYYDGETMIFTNYNGDNSELGQPVFFTKYGSQELLDKWIEQISE